ncbi:serine/threonine-protein kinase [Plantactinospora sp. KLBMP9567]|uniref:serine/threonine-protein kinase n=1 Tax=Plantactinospora sp. KLBMP9567 TaxID=3085900 RepID=UPI00298274D0|nr:protein kinase [Plantactinospora sp. KLBMP9567]MDW5330482.1 protein kinase [Plantactinospora sp. KLBMP9567]
MAALQAGGLLARRYRLIDRIGAGGMSVIWRARDEVLDRVVAVKVLAASLAADAKFREMVREEARAAAQLVHPHVTAVHDYGETLGPDGGITAFVVMELLTGEELKAELTAGPLPWQTAVEICAQVAEALAAAHRLGIVHRDITPANIMMTATGAKVLDFGIATQVGAPDEDEDGETFGTPAYVAPERLDGLPAQPATDTYSLGVLLHETLTGRVPFPADTWEELTRALEAGTEPTLAGVPDLPPAVADVCLRCLARDPVERPTAAQVGELLRQQLLAADPRRAVLGHTRPGTVPAAIPVPSPATSVLAASVPAAAAPPTPARATPPDAAAHATAVDATAAHTTPVETDTTPVETDATPVDADATPVDAAAPGTPVPVAAAGTAVDGTVAGPPVAGTAHPAPVVARPAGPPNAAAARRDGAALSAETPHPPSTPVTARRDDATAHQGGPVTRQETPPAPPESRSPVHPAGPHAAPEDRPATDPQRTAAPRDRTGPVSEPPRPGRVLLVAAAVLVALTATVVLVSALGDEPESRPTTGATTAGPDGTPSPTPAGTPAPGISTAGPPSTMAPGGQPGTGGNPNIPPPPISEVMAQLYRIVDDGVATNEIRGHAGVDLRNQLRNLRADSGDATADLAGQVSLLRDKVTVRRDEGSISAEYAELLDAALLRLARAV